MKQYLLIIYLGFYSTNIYAQNEAYNYGGKEEIKRIVKQELYYSQEALDNNYGGKVELSFTINELGQAQDIKVIQSVSEDLNKEAVRLLKFILWKPAHKNGQAIKSIEQIKFRFNPIKYNSICKQRGYKQEPPDQDYLFTVYPESELSTAPKFSGSEKSFFDFVKENLTYPEEAIKTEAKGFVAIEFVIEPTGRLTNIHISESLEANCDIVAKQLILKSNWTPGLKNGIPVRCLMEKKIFFSPSGNLQFITVPDRK